MNITTAPGMTAPGNVELSISTDVHVTIRW